MFIDLIHRYVRRRYARVGILSRTLELSESSVHFYENLPFDRTTVVLLHGLGTSSSTWFHVLPHLARSYKVIAIDLPGYGFSRLKTNEFFLPYDRLQKILGMIIPMLVKTPFVLVGHSLGGWLAADYAAQSGKQIIQLVMVNPAGIHYAGIEEQRRLFDIRDFKSLYALLNRLWWKYPWYFKLVGPAIFSDLRKRGVPQFVQTVREEDFLNEKLSRLEMPVSLIWAREDKVISEKTVDIVKRLVSQIGVLYIENCGHVPQLEKPGDLIAALDEILKRG